MFAPDTRRPASRRPTGGAEFAGRPVPQRIRGRARPENGACSPAIRDRGRNESNKPEFLIALFEDITDRRSLSQELESTKKFLELVVDNIPVALIVEQVRDGRYLLANRSAETILNRRREDATGLTAADIFNPQGSQADRRARRGRDQEARA